MTVSSQFLQLAALIGSGIAVAAIIDFIRVMKHEAPKSSLYRRWISIIELLVWLLLGIGTFILIFFIKQGAWRGIDPIAQIIGILLYQLLFQRPIRFIGRIFWVLIVKPVWLIIYGIYSIFNWTFDILIKVIMTILSPFFEFCSKFVKIAFKKR